MNKKILAGLLAGRFLFAGCSQDQADNKEETKVEESAEEAKTDKDTKPADDNSTDKAEEGADKKETNSADLVLPDTQVTLKAASYKFENHVGGAPYELTEVKFEQDGDKAYYEFEGNKDGKEYSLKVDANTAEETESEVDSDTDSDGVVDLNTAIPPEEAMRLALEENGGGSVVEWTLKTDGDTTIYEVETEDGNEIKVNALTKDIVK